MSRVSTDFSQDQIADAAYAQAIQALYDRINYEKIGHPSYSATNYRLDRMRMLLGFLGDPHLAAPVIHIAGTKGKGSTATFIARMLSAAGYRAGLYTSPHLLRLEERFQIDNRNCSPADFISLVEQTRRAAEQTDATGLGRATFFELTTAMAFLYFARRQANAVVLEVGMGGRLDSTNVCRPIATIITSIGLDHQAQLGNTIAAIAREKAGIIKPSIPVVSSARHPDAREVIEEVARRLRAPLRMIGRDFDCLWQAIPQEGLSGVGADVGADVGAGNERSAARCTFLPHYHPSHLGPSDWSLAMLGQHQADNLAAALTTMDALVELGWNLPRAALTGAVEQTIIPARLEPVGRRPWRLIDTAHNPDSVAATLSALDVHFPGQRRTIVLATSRDKDAEAMLRLVLGRCQRVILTQYHSNPRALPIEELVAAARRVASEPAAEDPAVEGRVAPAATELLSAETPLAAWRLAVELAGTDEVICATGSFFQAAELLAELTPAIEKSPEAKKFATGQ